MANENAILNDEFTESFDFDEFEEKLQSQLEEEFSELEFLKDEEEKIRNPDALGKVILDEVWKQFGNQIGLDMTNETLNQKYDREHQGETYDDVVILSILVDTFISKISLPMQPVPEIGSISVA